MLSAPFFAAATFSHIQSSGTLALFRVAVRARGAAFVMRTSPRSECFGGIECGGATARRIDRSHRNDSDDCDCASVRKSV